MKRQDVSPADHAALTEAARVERQAREDWNQSIRQLGRLIKKASQRGASLRAIATTIGRSHGRVRDILRATKAVR